MAFADPIRQFPQRVSSWNRQRKWELFRQRLAPGPATTVLDVGFSPVQYQEAENFFEQRYPWPTQVTALCIEPLGDAPLRYPDITLVRYDGERIPFDDDAFDVVWSNAVLEHVGDFAAQVRFLAELDRIGRRHFVTTPNRWFPVEVHTKFPLVHWLPQAAFDRIVLALGKPAATGDHLRLMSARTYRRALDEAGVTAELVGNRVAGMPMDFVAIW